MFADGAAQDAGALFDSFKRASSRKAAHTGAVTLIQRFGSALNLNIHFHMLFLDGVYVERINGL